MKKIDADHMKTRIKEPKTAEETAMVKTLIEFIDSEPEIEDDKIMWIPAMKKKHTRDCNTTRYGFECSKCKNFEDVLKRYCSDCGGRYDGELVHKNIKRFRR